MRVVVDANIAFRALAHGCGDLRGILDSARRDIEFFAPFFVLVELYKHKERIQRVSTLSEEDVLIALHELCECLTFIRETGSRDFEGLPNLPFTMSATQPTFVASPSRMWS